jgi:hypothetical protein
MGIPEDVYERSVAYGERVAKHILAYSNEDNYKKTRGYRHTLSHQVGGWEPTPPMYAEACEPRWNTIRTFTLDSVGQFPTPPPTPYDLDPKSKFFELVKEVHNLGKNMTEEQKKIAYFWDDNALVTNIAGHAAFTEKKMSPPGHWMAIVRSVARDKKLDMIQSTEAYALSAIGIFDAFIACWECKYKSDRVRPVTVINKSLDSDWMPFLETPPFPEYVSGHSAISASAGPHPHAPAGRQRSLYRFYRVPVRARRPFLQVLRTGVLGNLDEPRVRRHPLPRRGGARYLPGRKGRQLGVDQA